MSSWASCAESTPPCPPFNFRAVNSQTPQRFPYMDACKAVAAKRVWGSAVATISCCGDVVGQEGKRADVTRTPGRKVPVDFGHWQKPLLRKLKVGQNMLQVVEEEEGLEVE